MVEKLLLEFELRRHADTMTKHYSGGTKRKLQAAIALIGNPELVLLVSLYNWIYYLK